MPRRGAIPPHAGNPTWGGKSSNVCRSLKEGEAPRERPAGNASKGATNLEDK